MTIFYVNPYSGSDSNNGTSWALAKKTLTGVQGVLTSTNDTVYIAQTSFGSAGSMDWVNGSNKALFKSYPVTVLFDRFGVATEGCAGLSTTNFVRNSNYTNDYGGAASDNFKLVSSGCGGASSAAYVAVRAPAKDTGAGTAPMLTYMGAIQFATSGYPTTGATGSHYIVLWLNRLSSYNIDVAIQVNLTNMATGAGGTAPTSGYGFGISNISYTGASGSSGTSNVFIGQHAMMGPTSYGIPTGDFNAYNGQHGGDGDFVWFDVTALGAGTQLKNIGIFCRDHFYLNQVDRGGPGFQPFSIHGVFYVNDQTFAVPFGPTNFDTFRTTYGGNTDKSLVLLNNGDKNQAQMVLRGVDIRPGVNASTGLRGTYYPEAQFTFNWTGPTGTYTSRADYPAVLNANDSLTYGDATGTNFFTVKGGMNTSTSLQTGVTKYASAWTTSNQRKAFGPRVITWNLKSGALDGIGIYNCASGVKMDLGSSVLKFNYTFDDISGNDIGLDLSNATNPNTCPDRVFIHYKTIGPNNRNNIATYLASCSTGQWSHNFTKNWNPGITTTASVGWTIKTGGAQSVGFGFISSNASYTDFSILKQVLSAFSFASTTSSSVANDIIVGQPKSVTWVSTTSVTTAVDGTRFRSAAWSSLASASNAFTGSVARSASFLVNAVSSVVPGISGWKFKGDAASSTSVTTSTARSVDFSSSTTSSTPFDVFLSKGLAFDITNTTALIFSYLPIIPVDWLTSNTISVVNTLNRDRGYSFPVPMAAVVTEGVHVARGAAFNPSVTATVTPKLSKARNSSFSSTSSVSVASSLVVARLMRPVVTVVASVSNSLLRSHKFVATVTAISTVSNSIGRSRPGQWASSTTSTVGVNLLRLKSMAMTSLATSAMGVSLRRAAKVTFPVGVTAAVQVANNKVLTWLSSTASSIGITWTRNRPVTFSASELVASTFGLSRLRPVDFPVTTTSSSSLTLLRNRGYAFTIPMTVTMVETMKRAVGEQWSTFNEPVISIVANRDIPSPWGVNEVSGTTMSMKYDAMMGFVIGQTVTLDGINLKARRPLTETFGSSTSTSSSIGVGRGVKFISSNIEQVLTEVRRQVTLAFRSRTQNFVQVNGQSNRLTEFYVTYEEPYSQTLADGSIVLGQVRPLSSGILHDVTPVFDITLPEPNTIYITLVEND